MTKVLFLDESGDHSLTKIDPQYPVFVLGGIIVDLRYAKEELEQEVKDFKMFWGISDLILHTADITRQKNGFEFLVNPDTRGKFYEQLAQMLDRLDFKVVACAILKDQHVGRYGQAAQDPYDLSLSILAERFSYELGGNEKGVIVAECRHPHLDRALEAAWERLAATGTYYFGGGRIGRRITRLLLREKRDNIAGMQIADLVVSPIGRHVIGKQDRPDFTVVERKFRRVSGSDYMGTGLVILPKTDDGWDPLRSSQP